MYHILNGLLVLEEGQERFPHEQDEGEKEEERRETAGGGEGGTAVGKERGRKNVTGV